MGSNTRQASLKEQGLPMSISKLKLLFKEQCGCGPVCYFIQLKIQAAKKMICDSSMSFTQIAEQLGFGSVHYFSNLFKENRLLAFAAMLPTSLLFENKPRFQKIATDLFSHAFCALFHLPADRCTKTHRNIKHSLYYFIQKCRRSQYYFQNKTHDFQENFKYPT